MAREFKLPDLGEGIHEGEIVEVFVKPGNAVREGDPLLEVETDKAVTAIPSPFTGTVSDVRVSPGDVVTVGDVLVVFDGSAGEERACEQLINEADFLTDTYPSRWIALKYMESDEQIVIHGGQTNAHLAQQLEQIVQKMTVHIKETLNSYPEALIADHRYGYIKSILKHGVIAHSGDQNRLFISDKID